MKKYEQTNLILLPRKHKIHHFAKWHAQLNDLRVSNIRRNSSEMHHTARFHVGLNFHLENLIW